MDSSDEEVLLLFSLKLLSGANQKKTEKDVGAGNIKKKKKNRKVIYCRRYEQMIGNYITSNLYNELFSESSEPSTVKIAQLFSKHFIPDLSLSLYPLFPFS